MGRTFARVALVALGLLASRTADAQDAPAAVVPDETVPVEVQRGHAVYEPLGTAEFATAPVPGDAAGLRRLPPRSLGVRALWVPRFLLIAPRWALELVDAPIRGGVYVYDRYQLKERFTRVFFNDEETIGLYPVAFFETGFGLNVGARFLHRDLFGHREHLKVRASYGGRFQQVYDVKLESRELLGDRFSFELDARYEKENKSQFAGIGNLDHTEAVPNMVPADPTEVAVFSRFQQDLARVRGVFNAGIAGDRPARLEATVSAAYTWRTFSNNADIDSDESEDYVRLGDAYDLELLTGYEEGLSNLYVEAGLTFDGRRTGHWYQSTAMPASGWKLDAYLGRAEGFGDDPSEYFRYGVDLQRYFDLYDGSRVLALRMYTESVTGDLADVPFVDLPRLDGMFLLRGYPVNRFHDRSLLLGSAEYQFELDPSLACFLFVDAGKVAAGLDRLDEGPTRVGFGVGVEVHQRRSFVLRAFVGTSLEGSIQAQLSLDPAYDIRSRVERK